MPLFNGIITDLFPGAELPKPDYGVFMEALTDNCAKRHLQPVPWFLEKIVQVPKIALCVGLENCRENAKMARTSRKVLS